MSSQPFHVVALDVEALVYRRMPFLSKSVGVTAKEMKASSSFDL